MDMIGSQAWMDEITFEPTRNIMKISMHMKITILHQIMS